MQIFAIICAVIALLVTPLYFIFFRKGIDAIRGVHRDRDR